jgi:hypothetical protein
MAIVTRIHRPAETTRKHETVRRDVPSLLPTFFAVLYDLVRQYVGDRNLGQTALGLSIRANFSLVYRLLNIQNVPLLKQATPPKWK